VKRPTPWYVGLGLVAWPALLLYAVALSWYLAEATAPAQPHPQEVKNIGTIR